MILEILERIIDRSVADRPYVIIQNVVVITTVDRFARLLPGNNRCFPVAAVRRVRSQRPPIVSVLLPQGILVGHRRYFGIRRYFLIRVVFVIDLLRAVSHGREVIVVRTHVPRVVLNRRDELLLIPRARPIIALPSRARLVRPGELLLIFSRQGDNLLRVFRGCDPLRDRWLTVHEVVGHVECHVGYQSSVPFLEIFLELFQRDVRLVVLLVRYDPRRV